MGKKIHLIILLLILLYANTNAQDWNATLNVDPYPTSFVNDWLDNPDLATLNVFYTGTAPVTYYFKVIIESDEHGEILTVRGDNQHFDAGPATYVFNTTDLLESHDYDYDDQIYEQVIRSNRFPEGQYTATVELYNTANVLLTTTSGVYNIAWPDVPQLIFPQDQATVTDQYPQFQWVLSNFPPSTEAVYKFKLVERIGNQNVTQAIESNPVIYEAELSDVGFLIYPQDALELEYGTEYIWQVTVSDDEGEVLTSNNGNSEIFTFFYGYGTPAEGDNDLPFNKIDVIKNFAVIPDISGLQLTEDPESYIFNGTTQIEFRFANSTVSTFSVTLQDFALLKSSTFANPVIEEGQLFVDLQTGEFPYGVIGEYVNLSALYYDVTNGFEAAVSVKLPAINKVISETINLPLTKDGFTGEFNVERSAANPIVELSNNYVRFTVTGFSLQLPALNADMRGELFALDNYKVCDISNISFNATGDVSFSANCPVADDIPVIPGVNEVYLSINGFNGNFNGNIAENSFDYSFNLNSSLHFSFGEILNQSKTLNFTLDDAGLQLETIPGNSTPFEIDFNWMKIRSEGDDDFNLSYTPETGWDFSFGFEPSFVFPALENLTVGPVTGSTVDANGITIAPLSNVEISYDGIDAESFMIDLKGLSSNQVNLSWSELSGGSGESKFRFNFPSVFKLPNLPQGTDDDLKESEISFNWLLSGSNISANLPETNFGNLALPLAPGFSFNVAKLSGVIDGNISASGITFNPDIKLRGKIALPTFYFHCEDENPELDITNTGISLSGIGKLSGEVTNLIPPCGLSIGKLNASVTNTLLKFEASPSSQTAEFIGNGEISLGEEGENGKFGISFNYNLMEQKLVEFSGNLVNPFTVKYPAESPVFQFAVNEADIDSTDIIVNGASNLKLGDESTVDVAFNNVRLGFDKKIKAGTVSLTNKFAIVTELTDSSVVFGTGAENAQLESDAGVVLVTPDNTEFSKEGLSLEGSSQVSLTYKEKTLSLNAEFVDNCTFLLSPFKLNRGKIEFKNNDDVVASLTPEGFFPNASYFIEQAIPDTLSLPNSSLAYLVLKEYDELKVDVNENAESYTLTTKPGESVKMVIPGLKFNSSEDPEVNVQFSISVDKLDYSLSGGAISAIVPADKESVFDLSRAGIPYKIDKLEYSNTAGFYRFTFTGKVKSFGQQISSGDATLYYDASGLLSGDVALAADKKIYLKENSDKLYIQVDSLSGNFNVNTVAQDFDFTVGMVGGIKLKLSENKVYGGNARFTLTKDNFTADNFMLDQTVTLPSINTENFKIIIDTLALESLSYDWSMNEWDYRLLTKVILEFPGYEFNLPELPNVYISPMGIEFPSLSLNDLDLAIFKLNGFNLRPLNFRIPQGFTFDWYSFDMPGFNMPSLSMDMFNIDFELSFPDLPDTFPAFMDSLNFRMFDASFDFGANFDASFLTGMIQPMSFPNGEFMIPIGKTGAFFVVDSLGGSLGELNGAQDVNVEIAGYFLLPPKFNCSGEQGMLSLGESKLHITGDGKISGSINNVVPDCKLNMGYAELKFNNSSLQFATGNGEQQAIMDAEAVLSIQQPGGRDTVKAIGNISLDLKNGELLSGEIALQEPFVWGVPFDNPFMDLELTTAVFNKAGLAFSGEGRILLGNDASATVQFNDFLINVEDFGYKQGNLTIQNEIALKILIEEGALNWKAVNPQEAFNENSGVKLSLPANINFDGEAFTLNGNSGVHVKYGGNDLANLNAEFVNDTKLAISPPNILSGRVDFKDGNERVAYLDSLGFHPDNLLSVISIPDTLLLGKREVAFLVLKQQEEELVETQAVENGLKLTTKQGKKVKLVVPGLKYTGSAPEFDIELNIVVNEATFAPVSGAVKVEAANDSSAILSLSNVGIPLNVTGLGYEGSAGNYNFLVSAKLDLPKAISDLSVSLDSMVINENGLTGTVNLGNYSETIVPDGSYIKSANLGSAATFKMEGVTAGFGESNSVKFSGAVFSKLFTAEDDTTAIHFAAEWNNNNFDFSFDTDAEAIPLGLVEYVPLSLDNSAPINISFNESDFTLNLDGMLQFPENFSSDFALSFEDLQITKNSINVPDISITGDLQAVNLFGALLTLKDIGDSKALRFNYDDQNDLFSVTMTGNMSLFDKSFDFMGLQVDSRLNVSMEGTNILTDTTYLVENRVALTGLGVSEDDNVYYMDANGFIKLPPPANSNPQGFNFLIGTDGSIKGGANVVLFDDGTHAVGNDSTEYDLWVAKFDPEYAALELNFDNPAESKLKLIASFYFGNNDKYIRFGDLANKKSGFEISFANNATPEWSTPTLSPGLVNINWETLRLNLSDNGVEIENTDDGKFKLILSGEVAVNLPAMSGSLEFEELEITSDGSVGNIGNAIQAGDLAIANKIALMVNNIEYSSSPATISFAEGNLPGQGGSGSVSNTSLSVKNYFRFSGGLSIDKVGSGDIDEFLLYTDLNNNKNFALRGAHLTVYNKVDLNLDMTYRNLPGGGDLIKIAGAGVLKLGQNYNFAAVGKLKRTSSKTSFGVFMLSSGLNAVIGPGVMLNGLGGGFFLNPEASDLQLVKTMAGFQDPETSAMVQTTPGSFSALLYGDVRVGQSTKGVRGKALLTMTSNYMEVNGKAVLLDKENELEGDFYMQVGFNNPYAIGNIDLKMSMSKLIDGTANFGIYAFPNNQWALTGALNAKILDRMNVSGDLYIGDKGLYTSLDYSQNFNIWIIDITSGMNVKMWAFPGKSWGGYLSMSINAEVLKGLASASGTLTGALLGSPDFYLYGFANLKAKVLMFEFDGSVWAKLSKGEIKGGFGKDPSLERLLRNIENTASELETAKNDLNSTISQVVAKNNADLKQAFTVSQQQMKNVFRNMYDQIFLKARSTDLAERQQALDYMNALYDQEKYYHTWYYSNAATPQQAQQYHNDVMGFIDEVFAPRLHGDLEAMQGDVDNIKSQIDEFNSEIESITANLQEINNTINADSILKRDPGVNPVNGVSFEQPQFTQSGDNVVIENLPGFTLDEQASANNENTYNSYAEDVSEFEAMLVEQMNNVNELSQKVDNVFDNLAFENVRSKFRNLNDSLDSYYNRIMYYHISDKYIARNRRDYLYNNQTKFYNGDRFFALYHYREEYPNWFSDLGSLRYGVILDFGGESTDGLSLSGYRNYLEGLPENESREEVLDKGLNLYLDVMYQGWSGMLGTIDNTLVDVAGKHSENRQEMESIQNSFYSRLENLMDKKLQLTEYNYDLINRYIESRNEFGRPVSNSYTNMLNEIEESLKLPDLNIFYAKESKYTYCSELIISYSVFDEDIAYGFGEIKEADDTEGRYFPVKTAFNHVNKLYFPAETGPHDKNIQYTIMMRNKAGVAVRKSNTVTLSFEGYEGDGSANTTFVNYEDVTPPVDLTISFPRYANSGDNDTPDENTLYYLQSAKEIYAEWSAVDNESSVKSYLVAISDNPDPTTLQESDFVNYNTLSKKTFTGLNLYENREYYLYLKAENDEGLVSAVKRSNPVMLQGTPSSTPVVRLPQNRFFPMENGLPVDTAIAYQTADNYLYATWESQDAETEIMEYFVSVGTLPKADDIVSWFSNGINNEVTIQNEFTLQKGNKYYLNVYARDRGDLLSDTGYSPAVKLDDLAPSVPVIELLGYTKVFDEQSGDSVYVLDSGNELSVRFNSVDNNYLAGYKYTFANENDTSNVTESDFVTVNSGDVSITMNNLAEGFNYYLLVKAFDYGDNESNTAVSGKMQLPSSPPSTPVINIVDAKYLPNVANPADTVYYVKDSTSLKVSWSAFDAETGISDYRVAVGSTPGSDDLMSWTQFGTDTMATLTGFSIDATTGCYVSVSAKDNSNFDPVIGTSAKIIKDIIPPDNIVMTFPYMNDLGDSLTSFSKKRISVDYLASDMESGIKLYSLSVGTSEGSDNVKEWTGNGTNTSIMLTGLNLQDNVPYYVNINVEDSAGNNTIVSSAKIKYIGNRLFNYTYNGVYQEGEELQPDETNSVLANTYTSGATIQGNAYEINTTASDNFLARIELSSGDESVLLRQVNARFINSYTYENNDGLYWQNNITLPRELSTALYSFYDYYLQYKVMFDDGMWEDVTTVGPFKFRDMTPPTGFELQANNKYKNGRIRFAVTKWAYDAQTSDSSLIVEYSVGTEAGAQNVKEWSVLGSAYNLKAQARNNYPDYSLFIPQIELPEQGEVYLNLRAMNKDKVYGEISSVGPIVQPDLTPVALTNNDISVYYNLSTNNIQAPVRISVEGNATHENIENHLKGVEVGLGTNPEANNIQGWTQLEASTLNISGNSAYFETSFGKTANEVPTGTRVYLKARTRTVEDVLSETAVSSILVDYDSLVTMDTKDKFEFSFSGVTAEVTTSSLNESQSTLVNTYGTSVNLVGSNDINNPDASGNDYGNATATMSLVGSSDDFNSVRVRFVNENVYTNYGSLDWQENVTFPVNLSTELQNFYDYYLEYQVQNKFGLWNNKEVVGPLFFVDNSAPSAAKDLVAYPEPQSNGITFAIMQWPYDRQLPDSIMIQYSLGTTAGAKDVQGWTNLGYKEALQQQAQQDGYMNRLYISDADLPSNSSIYLNIRGVNKHNMAGGISSVGPISVEDANAFTLNDYDITASYEHKPDNTSKPIELNIGVEIYNDDVYDKFNRLEYSAGFTPDGNDISDWKTIGRAWLRITGSSAVGTYKESYGTETIPNDTTIYVMVRSVSNDGVRSNPVVKTVEIAFEEIGDLGVVELTDDNTNASVEVMTYRYPYNIKTNFYAFIQGTNMEQKVRGIAVSVGKTPGATNVANWYEYQGNNLSFETNGVKLDGARWLSKYRAPEGSQIFVNFKLITITGEESEVITKSLIVE